MQRHAFKGFRDAIDISPNSEIEIVAWKKTKTPVDCSTGVVLESPCRSSAIDRTNPRMEGRARPRDARRATRRGLPTSRHRSHLAVERNETRTHPQDAPEHGPALGDRSLAGGSHRHADVKNPTHHSPGVSRLGAFCFWGLSVESDRGRIFARHFRHFPTLIRHFFRHIVPSLTLLRRWHAGRCPTIPLGFQKGCAQFFGAPRTRLIPRGPESEVVYWAAFRFRACRIDRLDRTGTT